MQIQGKTALVTGAAGGLGQAIADELSRRGASLVLSGRNRAVLDEMAQRLGGRVEIADLEQPDDVERLSAIGAELDIVVANAGIGNDVPLTELDTESIDRSISVNLRAPILMTTAFVQAHLSAGTPGHVVLIGSLSGIAASPQTRMYNATKFGLRGFGLSIRQDLHGTGIGVSTVEPGFISEAGMFAQSAIDLPAGVRTKKPADVGRAVAEAIERDRGEVFVSPIELRLMSTLATLAPALSARVQRSIDVAGRKN